MALSDGVDHAIYLSVLLKELYPKFKTIDIPTEIFTDNKSLHGTIHSKKFVTEKRLQINIGATKELINHKKVINILWIKSGNQLGGCLTKTTDDCQKLIQVLSNKILPSNDM